MEFQKDVANILQKAMSKPSNKGRVNNIKKDSECQSKERMSVIQKGQIEYHSKRAIQNDTVNIIQLQKGNDIYIPMMTVIQKGTG